MTHDHAPSRPVDAIAERYVEEYAALDPIAATYFGIAGPRRRAARPLPRRLRRPRATSTRRALADAARRDAGRRARAGRPGRVPRAARPRGRDGRRRHVPQSEVSVIASGLHEVRAVVRPDADRGRGGAGATSTPASRPSRPRSTATGRRSREAADQGHVSAAPAVAEVAEQVRSWTGQEGRRRLLPRPRRPQRRRRRCATSSTGTPRAASDAVRRASAGSSATSSPRGAASARPSAASATPSARRYFLGATVDLEETYAWGWEELKRHRGRDGADRRPDRARRHGRRGGRRPRRRPGPRDRGQGERSATGCRSSPTAPSPSMADVHFDIPEPIRRIECCLAPDQRRRHLLHRPERGLHPPGPDVVVGARRHRRASPPGARSPPSSTRASRATTSRSPRRPTAASCSTAGSG